MRLNQPFAWLAIALLVAGAGCDTGTADDDDTTEDPASYSDPSYLTKAATLVDRLGEVVILDARPAEDYDAGHVEGAMNVAWQAFADVSVNPGEEGFGVALPPADLAAALAPLGIEADSDVVVIADPLAGWGEDGRIAWQLRMAGIDGTTVLDGGIGAWTDAGNDTTTDVPTPTASSLSLGGYDDSYVADTQWMQDHLDTAVIIDARAADEYGGAVLYGEARGGHLPGAINIPFTDVLEADGTLQSQEDLEALFSDAGISKDDEIAAYCTAGIRSAHLALVLRTAGYSKARNYDESFYWWAANEDLPLE